jgi:type II secretory pathway component PulF
MQIKAQTVIPPGTKITKCPPSEGKGKSVYHMERAQERKLEAQANGAQKKENLMAQKLAACMKVGYTLQEALKLVMSDSK